MAYNSRLMSDVLNVFVRAVLGSLRRRACELLGLRSSQSGAVTFVQRFGDALNLNVHFHMLALDGVYALGADERPEFHALPAPGDEEILKLTGVVAARIQSLQDRRGLGTGNSEEGDALFSKEPGLAALYTQSVRGRIAVGSNTGYRLTRLGDQIDGDSLDALQSPRCATVSGFSVHANVCIEVRDRGRLERLCRYAARPAVATQTAKKLLPHIYSRTVFHFDFQHGFSFRTETDAFMSF